MERGTLVSPTVPETDHFEYSSFFESDATATITYQDLDQLTTEWMPGMPWTTWDTSNFTDPWGTRFDQSLGPSSLADSQTFEFWQNPDLVTTNSAPNDFTDDFTLLNNMQPLPFSLWESQNSLSSQEPSPSIPATSPSIGDKQVVFTSSEGSSPHMPELSPFPVTTNSVTSSTYEAAALAPSTPAPKTEYTCKYCNTSFAKRHIFNRHVQKHTKPVRCPAAGCNHRTAKPRDMDRHIDVHHVANDDAVRSQHLCSDPACRFSRKGFKRKDHLKRHVERAHPKPVP